MMKKPTYPRLSCKADKRIKVCEITLKKIKRLSVKGKSSPEIAKIIGLNRTTVWLYLHPSKRKKQYKISAETKKKRYHKDAKFREKQKESVQKYVTTRYKNDKKFKKYFDALTKLSRIKLRKKNGSR